MSDIEEMGRRFVAAWHRAERGEVAMAAQIGPATISVYPHARESVVIVTAPVDWLLGPRSKSFQDEQQARSDADRLIGICLDLAAQSEREAWLATDQGQAWLERHALAEIERQMDARLAVLREPGTAERIDEAFARKGRLRKKPKAGPSF